MMAVTFLRKKLKMKAKQETMTQSLRRLVYDPDFNVFSEINEQEFDILFAETGADRELDFNREAEEEKIWNSLRYEQ